MSKEVCLTRGLASLADLNKGLSKGTEITDAEARELFNELKKLRTNLIREGKNTDQHFLKEAKRVFDSAATQSRHRAHAKQRKIIAEAVNINRLNNAPAERMDEAILSILDGSNLNFPESRVSISAEASAIEGRLLNGFLGELKRQGVALKNSASTWADSITEKYLGSGKFDAEIYKAYFDIFINKVDDAAIAKLNPQAVAVAKAIKKLNQAMLTTYRQAGMPVHELSTYFVRNVHDWQKIIKVAKKDWVDFTYDRINVRESFGEVTEDEAKEILGKMYTRFRTGKEGTFDPADLSKDISQSRLKKRTLHWKDGQSAFEYNRDFGEGNLAEIIAKSSAGVARSASTFKFLGPDPDAMKATIIDHAKKRALQAKDPVKATKLIEQKKGLIDAVYSEVTGIGKSYFRSPVANFFGAIRAAKQVALLGNVLFRSIPDLATSANNLMSVTGMGFYEAHKATILETMKHFASELPGGSKMSQQVAEDYGLFIGMLQGSVAERFGMTTGNRKMAKFVNFANRVNLSEQWNQSIKTAHSTLIGKELHRVRGMSMDELSKKHPRIFGSLERAGITKDDWFEISRATEFASGEVNGKQVELNAISVKAVEELPIEPAFREELAGKLAAFYNDQIDFATPSPSARERVTLRAPDPNSPLGVIQDNFLQFFTFPYTMWSKNLQKTIHQNGANTILEGMSQGSTVVRLAQMGSTMMAFAMIGDSLTEISRGRTPPNPMEMDNEQRARWAADIFQKSGAAGIYGDIIMGALTKGEMPRGGPVISEMKGLFQISQSLAEGRTDKAWMKAKRMGFGNLPNLFWLRGSLDYLFLNEMRENVSPGSGQRLRERMKEKQQVFLSEIL